MISVVAYLYLFYFAKTFYLIIIFLMTAMSLLIQYILLRPKDFQVRTN